MTQEQLSRGKLLVETLKSGAYQKGMGQLRRGKKFCCLGVACDLAIKDGQGHWNDSDCYERQGGDIPWSGTVPREIGRSYYGWEDANPLVKHPAFGRRTLAQLNDTPGVRHSTIAKLMEQQIYGGFKDLKSCHIDCPAPGDPAGCYCASGEVQP